MNSLCESLLQRLTLALLGMALFVRLFLSPYHGFVGDVNGMVQCAGVNAQEGLFAVTEVATTELWPAIAFRAPARTERCAGEEWHFIHEQF